VLALFPTHRCQWPRSWTPLDLKRPPASSVMRAQRVGCID
jgi:hypothetical protein